MRIPESMRPYYEGYAEAMLNNVEPEPVWWASRNRPSPEDFVHWLDSAPDMDTYEAWDAYLASGFEDRYCEAFQRARAGYILNALTEDSAEWADACTVADLRAAATHWAEAEWTEYL